MDRRTQGRLQVLTGVLTGEISVEEAALAMGLSPRHTQRVAKRFEAEGASALVHGNRGRAPANRLAPSLHAEILYLAENEYSDFNSDFNDVHLQEALERTRSRSTSAISVRTSRGISWPSSGELWVPPKLIPRTVQP